MQGNTIAIGRIFGEGWSCFKARPLFWIGTIILYVVISAIVSTVSTIVPEVLGRSTGSQAIAYALVFVFFLLNVFVSTRMGMGLVWMAVTTIGGKAVGIGDLFAKPHLFWRFLIATLLYNLMCLAGFILLFVPGIYLAVRFFPFNYVLIERETGILESFRQAQQLTQGHRGKLFAFVLLWGALLAGLMLPFIVLGSFVPLIAPLGLLLVVSVVMPIMLLSYGALYWTLLNASADQAAPA